MVQYPAGSNVGPVVSQIDPLPHQRIAVYDLVIFDEAHKLLAGRGNDLRVTKTDRYRLAEALAGVGGLD